MLNGLPIFATMLARLEACLNSRPLCPMTDNPSDINPLTLGHFVVESAILSPPEPWNLSITLIDGEN